jgi:hypothetical protein
MGKKYIYILLAVVLIMVVFLIWHYETKAPAAPNQQEQTVQPTVNQTKQAANPDNGQFWQGTLKASDNAKKGNLMLVMDKTTVYIHTSRDFSALLGKEVKVTYEGTVDSFQLGDIVGN